ncbi:MAG: hypothetical protein OHK0017_11500 [Patescibacteria group bacterium]
MFNSLAKDTASIDQVIKSLPESVAKSFNIGENYLSKVESFVSGQFLSIFILIGSIFAYFIGVGEIGGKIYDRTIANWLTKNLSRTQIYLGQWLTSVALFTVSNAAIWGLMYYMFDLFSDQSELSKLYFTYAAIGTLGLFLTWNAFGQMVSVVAGRAKSIPIGSTFIVFSWFVNNLANLNGFPQWIKPFSINNYFNIILLRDNFELDWAKTIGLVGFTLLFMLAGLLLFRRKDLYL